MAVLDGNGVDTSLGVSHGQALMGKSCPKRAIVVRFALGNQIKMKIKSNQDDFPWGKNSEILVENFGGANENFQNFRRLPKWQTANLAVPKWQCQNGRCQNGSCQNGICQNGRPAKLTAPKRQAQNAVCGPIGGKGIRGAWKAKARTIAR